MEAQDLVTEGMKEVFRLHGASPMASTGVGLAPADWAPDAVSLLAPCGDPWGLRYDLRYPFVAWLARQAALLGSSKHTPQPSPPYVNQSICCNPARQCLLQHHKCSG